MQRICIVVLIALLALVAAACDTHSLTSKHSDMPDYYRFVPQRVVIFSGSLPQVAANGEDPLGSGNILDINPRYILSTQGPSSQESRVSLASGGQLTTRRTHLMQIPLTTAEEAEFAEIMARQQECPVKVLVLGVSGSEHWVWYEPTRMNIVDAGTAAGGYGSRVLEIQTSVFDAAVWRGRDLLAGLPYYGAEASYSGALASRLVGVEEVAGDLVVADDRSQTITTYTGISNDLQFQTSVLQVNDIAYGDIYDGSLQTDEIQWVRGSDDIIRYRNLGGGPTGTKNLGLGLAVLGVARDDAGGASYVIGEDKRIYEYVDAAGSSFVDVSTTVAGTPESLAFDGTDLWVAAGTTVYQFDGFSPTLLNSYSTPFEVAGIAFDGLDLLAVSDGASKVYRDETPIDGSFVEDVVNVAGAHDLVNASQPGYQGPRLEVGEAGSVGISGGIAGVTSSFPAHLRFLYPVPGSTITITDESGNFDALVTLYDWNGDLIRTLSATNPTLEIAATGADADLWFIDIEGAPEGRIKMVVDHAGTPLGVRRGGIVSDCSNRVSLPEWSS